MCNSISEMNAAFQFDLARSSGHSEGCHHIRHWISWEQNMQVSCLVRAQLEVSNTSPCECQQHRCSFVDDGIGHLARRTLPQSSVSWYSNLRPSKSQNVQFDQWDECSVSVWSGQIFWTFGGLPSHKALSFLRTKHAGFLPRAGTAWGFKHIPLRVVFVFGFGAFKVNGRLALDSPCDVNWYAHNSQPNESALAGAVWALH